MPIYEYHCEGCCRKFETLVRGERPRVSCPECGSTKVKRLLSLFSARTGSSPAGGGGSCGSCRPGPGGCGSCRSGR